MALLGYMWLDSGGEYRVAVHSENPSPKKQPQPEGKGRFRLRPRGISDRKLGSPRRFLLRKYRLALANVLFVC